MALDFAFAFAFVAAAFSRRAPCSVFVVVFAFVVTAFQAAALHLPSQGHSTLCPVQMLGASFAITPPHAFVLEFALAFAFAFAFVAAPFHGDAFVFSLG